MFADTLRRARRDANVTLDEVAERTMTARAVLLDYETGRRIPSVDTAEHILRVMGLEYVVLSSDQPRRARIDAEAMAPLYAWAPDLECAIATARQDLALLVNADAQAERLDVTWGQVKILVYGMTIDGDAWSVWRTRELLTHGRAALERIEDGIEPRLRLIVDDRIVTANDRIVSTPHRAMDFLVRATGAGADPAYVRHLVGSFLAHHGYPWLWVRTDLRYDYRRALVACRRHGDGTALVRVMTASITPSRQ